MLGQKIRHLRKDHALSLGELAQRAGCAKSYLSDIERGIRDNPSLQFIEKIAHVLHVPTTYFLEKGETKALHSSVGLAPELVDLVRTLDPSWLQVTRDAADSGLTQAQFREFIAYYRWKHQKPDSP